MKNKKFIHCFSVILRAATLFSKFALVIMLAKLIPGGDVGLYGLLSAAIGYAIFIVGFEFYTYSTREMIAYPREQWGWMLKNQIVLTISVYIMFLPLLYFLYYLGILPVGTEFWFIALLIVEYVSQEINRVLITGRNYLLASIILFLRQGIWCWVVVAIMLMMPSLRNVYTVLIVWLVASGAACIIGGIYIFQFTHKYKGQGINWQWIKKGLKLSLPMLMAALAIRGIFTFDRFAIKDIGGLDVLGAYVFFASMASAVQSFLDTIVISFAFPELSKLAAEKKHEEFWITFKRFLLKTFLMSIFLCICCWLSGLIVLHWLNNQIYDRSYSLFIFLIFSTLIYCLSLIPHLGLYALREDTVIIKSQVVSLIVFIGAIIISIMLEELYMVMVGMIL
ncbi:polysaccharide biosynthesis protein, partial [Salmonella enterica]|nr:polysaccharide biosynthesis protein [Salmonella enterica]